MHVPSGCERKRRRYFFSQLRSRVKCFFYASENRQKEGIHAKMYDMLNRKKKLAGDQGPRLPHQIITKARGVGGGEREN